MEIITKQIESYLVEILTIYEMAVIDAKIQRKDKLELIKKKIKNSINKEFFNEALDKSLTEEIAKVGGRSSGVSRSLRTNLIIFFLKKMKVENEEYFKNYSAKNYALLSKEIFGITPANKTILTLIDDKNACKSKKNRKEFSSEELFKAHLKTVIFDEELSKIVDRYYKMFKNTMKENARSERNLIRKIEKEERELFEKTYTR